MDNPITLLVAIMYVTVLVLGIANILADLARVVVTERKLLKGRKIQIGWVFLLFLVHLNLFWHTKELLNVEPWTFSGFLFIIAGPVVLFFATQILLSASEADEEASADQKYLAASRRFFFLILLLQLWTIFVDISLARTLLTGSIINILFGVLALILMFVRTNRAHAVGCIVGWVLVLVSLILTGFSIFL